MIFRYLLQTTGAYGMDQSVSLQSQAAWSQISRLFLQQSEFWPRYILCQMNRPWRFKVKQSSGPIA